MPMTSFAFHTNPQGWTVTECVLWHVSLLQTYKAAARPQPGACVARLSSCPQVWRDCDACCARCRAGSRWGRFPSGSGWRACSWSSTTSASARPAALLRPATPAWSGTTSMQVGEHVTHHTPILRAAAPLLWQARLTGHSRPSSRRLERSAKCRSCRSCSRSSCLHQSFSAKPVAFDCHSPSPLDLQGEVSSVQRLSPVAFCALLLGVVGVQARLLINLLQIFGETLTSPVMLCHAGGEPSRLQLFDMTPLHAHSR